MQSTAKELIDPNGVAYGRNLDLGRNAMGIAVILAVTLVLVTSSFHYGVMR